MKGVRVPTTHAHWAIARRHMSRRNLGSKRRTGVFGKSAGRVRPTEIPADENQSSEQLGFGIRRLARAYAHTTSAPFARARRESTTATRTQTSMEILVRAAFVAPASRVSPLPRASRRSGSRLGGGTVVPGATRRGWGETDNRFSRLDKRRDRSARDEDRYDDSQRNISFQELRKRQDRELRKVRRSEHRRRRATERIALRDESPPPLALQTRSPIPASLHLIHPPGIPQERGADGDYWGDDDELGGWSRFMGEESSGKSAALKKGKSRRDAAVAPPRRTRLRRHRHRRRRSHRSPKA